jgi:thiol-disulfide isomerase/thioredoxin
MDTMQTAVAVAVLGFVGLSMGLQVMARRRASALNGQPLPPLQGELGARIGAAPRALVYFFTPTCGACRAVTPRMRALAEKGEPVFPVDATLDPDLARALSVMATPTTVEVDGGRVVKVHIGPVPAEVYARFGA